MSAVPEPLTGGGTIGYTAGVFDLFDAGHVSHLRTARTRCDLLVVGVLTDALAERLRGRPPVVPFVERMAIVGSVRHVDQVVPHVEDDELAAWPSLRFDVLFAAEGRRLGPAGRDAADRLAEAGVRVEHLPGASVHNTPGAAGPGSGARA